MRKSLIPFYVSQILIALVGIVTMPLYLQYLGKEAFGLVGFYAVLQALFQLLDAGLTPTMLREVTQFRAGARSGDELRQLLRALEGIFVLVATACGIGLILASSDIASRWLSLESLTEIQVTHALMLMILSVCLRWISALYRGVVNGFERFAWLSVFSVSVACARFLLVIPFFIYVSTDPVDYFAYQLVIALVELTVLIVTVYGLLPPLESVRRVAWRLSPLKRTLSFSIGIAVTSSLWVATTQLDKFILSKLIPLSQYGLFTLAVLVASGVLIITRPIAATLLPGLSRLHGEENFSAMLKMYRDATQIACVIAVPATAILVFFPSVVLHIWINDPSVSAAVIPVLVPYAIGNCVLSLGSFVFYLQFAKGRLALHVIGSLLFIVFLVPVLIWATGRQGAIGAGHAWLGINLLYFLLWTPLVHRKYAPGLHGRWLLVDILPVSVATLSAAWIASEVLTWTSSRLTDLVLMMLVAFVLYLVAGLSSPVSRTIITKALQSLIQRKNA